MNKTILNMSDEEFDKLCKQWFESPEGKNALEQLKHDMREYENAQKEKKKHRIRKFFKQLFCEHQWEDGSNLPGCQSFICSKCNKEFWWYPEIGDDMNDI